MGIKLIYFSFLPDKDGFTPHGYKELQHKKALALLKYAVKKEHGYDTDNMILLTNPHGKPFFKDYPDIRFNLSHCTGMAVCMTSEYSCGVDAETVREYKHRTASKVLSNSELSQLESSTDKNTTFFRFWTLKESFVKAIGYGFAYPLNSVSFSLRENGSI